MNTFVQMLRERTGLSQTELAMKLGTDQSTVSRMESGERFVSSAIASKAAAMIGTTEAAVLVADAVSAAKSAVDRGTVDAGTLFQSAVRLGNMAKKSTDPPTREALEAGVAELARLISARYTDAEIEQAAGKSGRLDNLEDPYAGGRDAHGRATVKPLGSSPRDVDARREREPITGDDNRDGFGRSRRKIYS